MDAAGNTTSFGITSTSTLLLTSGVILPKWWLRTYGMVQENLGSAADAGHALDGATFTEIAPFRDEGSDSLDPALSCTSTYDASAYTTAWISFADSEGMYFARSGVVDTDMPLEFVATVFLPGDETTEALAQATCVPGFKAPVKSGIAVSRFRFTDVKAEVVDVAAVLEEGWSGYTGSLGWRGPVTGQQLGYIRVWMTGGTIPPGTVAEWHEFLAGVTGAKAELHKADPAPMNCGKSLVLFFAANVFDAFSVVDNAKAPFAYGAGGPFSGHGIWRAIAMEEGIPLPTDTTGMGPFYLSGVYGRDFYCDATADTPRTGTVLVLGQVIHSRNGNALFIDPDPVALPDGSARVFFGQPQGPFQFVSGTPGVPCRDDLEEGIPDDLAAAAPFVVGSGPDNGGPWHDHGRAGMASWGLHGTGPGR